MAHFSIYQTWVVTLTCVTYQQPILSYPYTREINTPTQMNYVVSNQSDQFSHVTL